MPDDLLPWGWEWDELRKIASTAAAISRARYLSHDDRVELALNGVMLALVESEEPVTRRQLVDAGLAEIDYANGAEVRNQGIAASRKTGARFTVYWHTSADRTAAPWEEVIDERIAIWQAVWGLSETEWSMVWAMSQVMIFGGGLAAAAALLGIEPAAASKRLNSARRKVRAWWVAPGEQPAGWYRRRENRIHHNLEERRRRRKAEEAA